MKNYRNNYSEKENDAMELIGHLIMTKPSVVIKLLGRHGIHFSFRPEKKDLVNEVIDMILEDNPSFNQDLEKQLAIHLDKYGVEIMALESQRALMNKEDEFLGGLVAGLAKGVVGSLKGALTGFVSNTGVAGGGADRAKQEMDRKMQRMEEERKRKQAEEHRAREERDRRRREEEDMRRRREEERRRMDEQRRRMQEEANRMQREMAQKQQALQQQQAAKAKGGNGMVIGLVAVLAVGGVIAFTMMKRKAAA